MLDQALRRGQSKSCGCQANALRSASVRKHGMSETRTYHAWENMRARVRSKDAYMRKYYAERGIGCDYRWLQFENFYADMGDAPDGMTLDRIDNSKGYSKANCRWATQRQQMNNISRNKILNVGGVSMTMSDWARATGIKRATLDGRMRSGWSPVDAVSKPVATKRFK